MIVRVVGDEDSVKFGATTVSETLVVRVSPPPVPVTVIAYVPAGVAADVVAVSVVEAPAAAGLAEKP